ncbi:MAG TPA: hypothetical protein VK541_08400 [Pedobacter sp.]|uniref:hypothetical protein n=1 Tax=Pedobacter sp. TaxID=1411316 RepID=UPI002C8042B5|nr:hypothetical protein [Pedobacter sp.]HMI02486.1 hypothetical protein [Pedobacter sp.]
MNHKKEFPKQQHCPACNRYVKYSERYPNYACAKCTAKAVDKNGETITFFNTTFDGHGCQGKLIATDTLTSSKICFIKGIKFRADEAYLGGIVLLPDVKLKRNRRKSDAVKAI